MASSGMHSRSRARNRRCSVQASYTDERVFGTLVHPDDLPVVDSHIRFHNSAIYDVRLKRGVGNNAYKKLRVQGFSFTHQDVACRLSLLKEVT